MDDPETYVRLAAHELLEPLVTIEAFTTLVLEGAAGPEELQRILRITRRTRGLVEALLMESRAEAVPLRRNPVDLAAVVEAACEALSVEADARGVEFAIGSLPTVPGDERLLTALMTNLMLNVLKYGPERTAIAIEYRPEGSEVVVTIGAAGAGSAADTLRTFSSPARRETDFGLGLLISTRLAERHGGRLDVVGEERDERRYVLALPAA